MSIKLTQPQPKLAELKPRITVIGVGGAGGNAVNNMIRAHLEGVEFVVANTDAQSLSQSLSERRIQLGTGLTQGLGAGARPDVGRNAAEECIGEVLDQVAGSHMVFIAAGMGGGTGTGAAPVIARATREQGMLTVGVVTKPFHFEGQHRMRLAESGIEELQHVVDTLIIIPNQNLFRIANERTTFAEAFKLADDVLYSGVRGVTDLMVMPGLINLDFADVRTVMAEMGKAMMGTGEAEGDNRALEAAQKAISNPLLDDVSMKGARGVLINITGGPDMTLFEVDEAANRIRDEVDPEANIIFGSTFDETLTGRMRISVVATGIDAAAMAEPAPTVISLASRSPRMMPASTAAPAMATRMEAAPTPMKMSEPAFVPREQHSAPAVASAPMRAAIQPQPTMQPAPSIHSQPVHSQAPRVIEPRSRPIVADPPMARQPMPNRPSTPMPPQPRGDTHQQPQRASEPSIAMPPRQERAPAPVERPAPRQSQPMATDIPPIAPRAAAPAPAPEPIMEREPVRKPSLFEKMIGVGRARAPEPQAQQPARAEPPAARTAPPAAPAPAFPPRAPAAMAPRVGPPPVRQPAPQPAASRPAPAPRPAAAQAPAAGPGWAQQSEPEQEAPAPKPVEAPAQPRLGGLEPPAQPRSAEDDLLEIPTFLRRQAN